MNVEIELEERVCENCSRTFRVMPKSTTTICSQMCAAFGTPALGVRKNKSQPKEKNRTSINVNVTPPTKRFVSEHLKIRNAADLKTLQPTVNEQRKSMNATVTNIMPSVSNGDAAIENDNLPLSELGTPETKIESDQQSTAIEVHEIPLGDSTKQSLTTELVASHSMNLLDDTATHLHGLMKSLQPNKQDKEIGVLDTERVNAACNCANQIQKIMKLKLDAIKLQRAMR